MQDGRARLDGAVNMEAAMRRSGLAFLGIVLFPLPAAALTLTSPDLKDGAAIASEQIYTRCGGANISPALSWSGVPAGTKSLAVTVIDTDVPPNDWSHWIVLGLPATLAGFPKGMKTLPSGAVELTSDFGEKTYDGPCPPAGSGVHHYRFTVWALSVAMPRFKPSATAKDVAAILTKDARASATITGTVER